MLETLEVQHFGSGAKLWFEVKFTIKLCPKSKVLPPCDDVTSELCHHVEDSTSNKTGSAVMSVPLSPLPIG